MTINSHKPLLLLLLLVSLAPHPATPTCYAVDGSPYLPNVWPGALLPCDPAASVSTCCNPGDLCLSNGLCLNAVANNRYTVQGCTDPNWPAPGCVRYCGKAGMSSSPVFGSLGGNLEGGRLGAVCPAGAL